MFELMGCMWMLNMVLGGYPIEMNAVFVVNLITALGLAVEFCNHVGMNFMRQTGTKEARAKKALAELGSSVLVGIASTKFIGVIVMAFAPSTIFRLYYFRMYLFIIFLGCFNGLMVLPILLKYLGPEPVTNYILMSVGSGRSQRRPRNKGRVQKAGEERAVRRVRGPVSTRSLF